MKKTIITLAIILAVVFVFFLVDVPYYLRWYCVMYDGISYDGTIYYHAAEDPDMGYWTSEKVPVHIVFGNKINTRHVEYANLFLGDDGTLFLHFDSGSFTTVKGFMSSPHRALGEDIPREDLLCSSDSPDQRYTVNFYLVNVGGILDNSILGELVDNTTGNAKTIYWQYRSESTQNEWIDEYTININGQTLDVREDTYDSVDHRESYIGPSPWG